MRCLFPLRARRAAFVFPSMAGVPMANAGEVPKFSHWGYAEPLSESRGGFLH